MVLQPLILTLSLAFAADKGLEPLQGTWEMQKLVGRGKDVPPEKAKAIVFRIAGDQLQRFVNDIDRKDPSTIKVDAGQKPAHLDLTPAKEGDPKMLGIYELDGDTLKICMSSKKRPDKFDGTEGDAILMILKRVRK
jgi:uncharacterized protein (TIGR03067 family)